MAGEGMAAKGTLILDTSGFRRELATSGQAWDRFQRQTAQFGAGGASGGTGMRAGLQVAGRGLGLPILGGGLGLGPAAALTGALLLVKSIAGSWETAEQAVRKYGMAQATALGFTGDTSKRLGDALGEANAMRAKAGSSFFSGGGQLAGAFGTGFQTLLAVLSGQGEAADLLADAARMQIEAARKDFSGESARALLVAANKLQAAAEAQAGKEATAGGRLQGFLASPERIYLDPGDVRKLEAALATRDGKIMAVAADEVSKHMTETKAAIEWAEGR